MRLKTRQDFSAIEGRWDDTNTGRPGEAQILKPPPHPEASYTCILAWIHAGRHKHMYATHVCLNNRLRPFCPTSQSLGRDEGGAKDDHLLSWVEEAQGGDQELEISPPTQPKPKSNYKRLDNVLERALSTQWEGL